MIIVLATDGSDNARFAAEFLERYPAPPGTKIFCCSVYSPITAVTATAHPVLGAIIGERIAAAIEEAKQTARKAAHDASESLARAGFDTEALVMEGDPASKICEITEEKNASLTVFGAVGKSGVEGLLTGSVARALVHQTKGNFLVVRQHPFALPKGLRAVYATDLGEQSFIATKALPELAPTRFEELEIVTVASDMSAVEATMRSGKESERTTGERDPEEWRESIANWREVRLTEIQNELMGTAELISKTVILEGDPRRALVEHVADRNADLLIVGARTHSILTRLFIGSVSEHLVYHAPCSVMVIRK